MTKGTLLELALAEEEARHCGALAAIRARAGDITEAQKLSEAIAARGLKCRPTVDTVPVGAQAECRISLWMTATPAELRALTEYLSGADIALVRTPEVDIGDIVAYELSLRGQTLRLKVALHDAVRPRFVHRGLLPEAA